MTAVLYFLFQFCLAEGICPSNQFKCGSGDCISLKLRCDGFNDCGDNSDEANCQFYISRRCAIENQNCSDLNFKKDPCFFGFCSQICIEKKNSVSCQCGKGYKLVFDEGNSFRVREGTLDKPKNTKAINSNEKETLDKKHEQSSEISRSCKAIGTEASLVVVRESDVIILSPYKSRGTENQYDFGKSNFKIRSIDILYNDSKSLLFFTDYTKKRIVSLTLSKDDLDNQRQKREIERFDIDTDFYMGKNKYNLDTQYSDLDQMYKSEKKISLNLGHNSMLENSVVKKVNKYKSEKLIRVKRGYENPKPIIEELHDPRAIAVDWIVGRLYYIDKIPSEKSAVIMVSTLQGRKKTSIIKNHLVEPFDLAVDPNHGFLFFTDCNVRAPKIERSFMDGSLRKLLVTKNIICPSGISIDYPASTLYFVDTKLKTLESIDFSGENRMVMKAFGKDSLRPYKLEIFEDYAYVSLYENENVLRMNKFGRNEAKSIIQGVRSRMSDVVIVQESKQEKDLYNPCQSNSCHDSSLCVIGSSNVKTRIVKKSCLCPDGLQKTVLANMTVS